MSVPRGLKILSAMCGAIVMGGAIANRRRRKRRVETPVHAQPKPMSQQLAENKEKKAEVRAKNKAPKQEKAPRTAVERRATQRKLDARERNRFRRKNKKKKNGGM